MDSVIGNIKKRRSIRKYTDKAISDDVVKKLIEAGRYAPSSHNSQPWRFVVVTNKKKINELSEHLKGWFKRRLRLGGVVSLFSRKMKKTLESIKARALSDKDLFFYDAPLLVLICGKGNSFTVKDCSCAAENMMLAARSMGIGSCWIGYADMVLNKDSRLMDELGVPSNNDIIATLVFGHTLKFPENGLPRKEEADIVKWIK
jgi:nitroreductase|tara:strand:+ start:591 stop:1196 length:606 start_codon:yes stop_codon:yes gene_type:complete